MCTDTFEPEDDKVDIFILFLYFFFSFFFFFTLSIVIELFCSVMR